MSCSSSLPWDLLCLLPVLQPFHTQCLLLLSIHGAALAPCHSQHLPPAVPIRREPSCARPWDITTGFTKPLCGLCNGLQLPKKPISEGFGWRCWDEQQHGHNGVTLPQPRVSP